MIGPMECGRLVRVMRAQWFKIDIIRLSSGMTILTVALVAPLGYLTVILYLLGSKSSRTTLCPACDKQGNISLASFLIGLKQNRDHLVDPGGASFSSAVPDPYSSVSPVDI